MAAMSKRIVFLLLLALPPAAPAGADEGMWLFNRPPRAQIQQRYGFTPSDAWLEHLQKSSIRFNNGGSGSFLSADGLILTNHHVGFDCLQEISTPERNIVENGYRAKTRADELQCPGLELNVLMSIEDVTKRVNGATANRSGAEAESARRAAMTAIEKESLDRTGLRSDVVMLFQGAEYHLYRYRKYTDVRLVFAPEEDIAFFGGDPDNFEYPRYNLDVTFFRAYENGSPARVPHWLEWSKAGVKEGDFVMISGNPGGTERLNTVAHLEYIRDVRDPFILEMLRRREVLLRTYSQRSAENERRAKDDILSIENSRKAIAGELETVQNPSLIGGKRASENEVRKTIAANAELQAAYGGAWDAVAKAIAAERETFYERRFLENSYAFNSRLFGIARTIVRLAAETAKPNEQRLREYRESNLESVRHSVLAEVPIYVDLQTVTLADSLSHWMERRPNDPLVAQAMAGKSPRERAAELVRGTKLADVAVRRQLIEGGWKAAEASDDPMIRLARLVDARSRELRKRYEAEVTEPLAQAYAKIANAWFRTAGGESYPDATFTPRISYGAVKGYVEEGAAVPAFTNFAGLYERAANHENIEPYDLPKRWLERKANVDPAAPFNFVASVDTTGGNSGSPLVDRAGEFVGIAFDGNLPTLGYNFAYQDVTARGIAVDARGIIESLRGIYGATELIEELLR
jgi:hypothetical protein